MAKKNTVEIILAAKDMASKATKQAFGSIQSSASAAMGTVARASAAAVVALGAVSAAVGKVGVQYNAMMEQSEIAWSTILGSTEKAKDTLKQLQVMGAKTPFEFEGLDKAAKLLNMAGFEGDKLFTTLTNVGDAVSAVGGGQDELEGISMAIFQMASKGKISAEEMNQLAERGIPAWKMIGDEMGKSGKELMEMSQNGELFADEVLPLLIDGMGNKFGGAMDKQSKTFNGMLSTLKDNLKILSAELSKGLFEKLKKGMETALPVLDAFTEFAKGNMVKFTEILTKAFGVDTAVKIINFSLAIKEGMDVAKQALDKAKDAISGVFALFQGNTGKGVSILTNLGLSPESIKMIIEAVSMIKSYVIGYLSALKEYWTGLFSGDGNLGQSFIRIFEVIKSIALPILLDAFEFIKSSLAELKAFWDENGAQIIQAVKNMWSIIATIFEAIAPVLTFIIEMIWGSIKGLIHGALNVIMGLIKIFAGLFTGDWSKMWEGIKQFLIGALEAIWNLLNLMFIGRVLKGIGSFFKLAYEGFLGWGRSIGTFFVNLWNGIVKSVTGFKDSAIAVFNTFRQMGLNVFQSLKGTLEIIWQGIRTRVLGFIDDMITKGHMKFSSLVEIVRSIFNTVKNLITNPIQTAKDIVLGIITTIKNAFANMKITIPKPKMPKVSVDMKKNSVGIPYPEFDVTWHKTGGVFTKPVIYGNAGFGDVEEGIIPFEGPHAKKIAGLIGNEMDSLNGSTGSSVSVNVNLNGGIYTGNKNEFKRFIQNEVIPIISREMGGKILANIKV